MAESTPPKSKPEEAPLIETLESLSTALQSLQLRIGLLSSSADRVLTLSDVQSLQAHLLKFSKKLDDPVPRLRCPECTARFHRLDRLFAHCQTYHPDRDYLRLACSCPKTFKYLRQRNEHMRIEHRDEYENERLLIEKPLDVGPVGNIQIQGLRAEVLPPQSETDIAGESCIEHPETATRPVDVEQPEMAPQPVGVEYSEQNRQPVDEDPEPNLQSVDIGLFGKTFFGRIDNHLLGFHECLGLVDGYLKSPVVEDMENGALDDYLAIYLLQLGGAGIGEFGEFAD